MTTYSTKVGNQLLTAVGARLTTLGVSEVDVQDRPVAAEQIRPGTYVTQPTKGNGDWEEFRGANRNGTNERTHIGYGCQITHVAGDLGPFNERSDDVIDIRQLVMRRFQDKRLDLSSEEMTDTGVVELGCTVVPGTFQPEDDNDVLDKWDITVMVVRCWVGETRDVSVE